MKSLTMLDDVADVYARLAVQNIRREFPAGVSHTMTEPGDFPYRPKDRNPAFYGSFDWHSCVEMHWLLLRLLRTASDRVPVELVLATLDEDLTAEALATEAVFMADPRNASKQRPYGWGWGLALADEARLLSADDVHPGEITERAKDWTANLAGLADVLAENFVGWLALSPYPVRTGLHPNSAFGLSRALPFAKDRARYGDSALLDAIEAAARDWFADDYDYPGRYEPSGHDFLSPALAEAELMSHLLPRDEFSAWFDRFLPGVANGEPAALFTPVRVVDDADGQTAHLHGLNLSRAWCWRRIAEVLGNGDARTEPIRQAADRHADATLPRVVGSDYMVEHWLAAYAVLYLTG